MTHVEILKAARRLIKASMKGTGKFHPHFICLAIRYVTMHTDAIKGLQLIEWIGEMIHPYHTLDDWLMYNVHDADEFDTELVNAHRLLWLDRLIKEYEQ